MEVNCSDNLIFVIVGHIGKKEYAEASRYINPMHKVVTGNGLNAPRACPARGIKAGKNYYDAGYHETVYKILSGMKSPTAEKHALRAYLCASLKNSNYKNPYTIEDDAKYFSRKNFINHFNSRNAGSKYDIQIYLDDILEKVVVARTEIYKDGMTHAAHVKMIVLYKNAAKQCDKIGLSPEFSKFFIDKSIEATHDAKDRERS